MNSNVHVWMLLYFVYFSLICQLDSSFAGMNQSNSQIEMNKQKMTTTKRGHCCSCSAFGKVRFSGHLVQIFLVYSHIFKYLFNSVQFGNIAAYYIWYKLCRHMVIPFCAMIFSTYPFSNCFLPKQFIFMYHTFLCNCKYHIKQKLHMSSIFVYFT